MNGCLLYTSEEVLERCLRPVRPFVEEIIIADTGSKDSTKVIAAGYADQVYSFPWNDDFAAARNFAFSKASMDYCMWLDADDVMTQENLEKLKIWKNQEDRADVVMMKYLTGVDEKGRPSLSYYRERLLKNHSGFWWKGKVHEAIPLAGTDVYKRQVPGRRKRSAVYRRSHGTFRPVRRGNTPG